MELKTKEYFGFGVPLRQMLYFSEQDFTGVYKGEGEMPTVLEDGLQEMILLAPGEAPYYIGSQRSEILPLIVGDEDYERGYLWSWGTGVDEPEGKRIGDNLYVCYDPEAQLRGEEFNFNLDTSVRLADGTVEESFLPVYGKAVVSVFDGTITHTGLTRQHTDKLEELFSGRDMYKLN